MVEWIFAIVVQGLVKKEKKMSAMLTVRQSFTSCVPVGLNVDYISQLVVNLASFQVKAEAKARVLQTRRVWLMLLLIGAR